MPRDSRTGGKASVRFPILPVILLAAAPSAAPVLGQASPWLPAPGAGDITVSYVSQEATEFYRQTEKRPTPGGGNDLEQQTLWVTGSYGLSDAWALDLRVGTAESTFPAGPMAPFPPKENLSGLVDLSAGIVWRMTDELTGSGATTALRGGVIIAGDYTTGYISSLGDGGDGAELSVIVGKLVGDRVAVSGELGYRHRNSNVPADTFLNLSAGVAMGAGSGLSLDYRMVDAESSGLDIGVPPFTPARFPELEEDIQLLIGTLSFSLTDTTNLGVSYGAVLDGRNTAASDVVSVSVGFSFDTY